MHTFPSQLPLPFNLTNVGIFAVSSSSKLCRIPSLLRKPTIILGTPSKNDWIQNLRSLRSYLRMSRSDKGVAAVFSSTFGPSWSERFRIGSCGPGGITHPVDLGRGGLRGFSVPHYGGWSVIPSNSTWLIRQQGIPDA